MARIDVINNSPDVLDLYQDILSFDGHGVTGKRFNSNTLQELHDNPPDLVLLDFPLGLDEDGTHFLKTLRASPYMQSIPILLCTTMPRAVEQQRDFLERNRIHVLLKPFELEELSRVVRAALCPA